MTRILLNGRETSVSEEVDEVLSRIVAARDGLRRGSDAILAPRGWLQLTSADTADELYIQAEHIGYVCED